LASTVGQPAFFEEQKSFKPRIPAGQLKYGTCHTILGPQAAILIWHLHGLVLVQWPGQPLKWPKRR
jgi:hypothetical protein